MACNYLRYYFKLKRKCSPSHYSVIRAKNYDIIIPMPSKYVFLTVKLRVKIKTPYICVCYINNFTAIRRSSMEINKLESGLKSN